MSYKKDDDGNVVEIDSKFAIINGKKWLNGHGADAATIMVIYDQPSNYDIQTNNHLAQQDGKLLRSTLRKFNIDLSSVYFTSLVKYSTKIKASDIKLSINLLKNEIRRIKPKVILALGNHTIRAMFGNKAKLSSMSCSVLDYYYGYDDIDDKAKLDIENAISIVKDDLELNKSKINTIVTALLSDYHTKLKLAPDYSKLDDVTKVVATYLPNSIIQSSEFRFNFELAISMISKIANGINIEYTDVESRVIRTIKDFREFADNLTEDTIVLDLEWDGITWMDPNRYTRTIQIGYANYKAAVIHLRGPGGTLVFDDEDSVWPVLNSIVTRPDMKIIGHNIIADGQWLLGYGVDIRKNVYYDTMLMEHLLSETGPFSLSDLTLKYTDYGRYDIELNTWLNDNKKLCLNGYGNVPDELLLKYAALDVQVPRSIFEKQVPLLVKLGFTKPRHKAPTLIKTVMQTQEIIYELERTGLGVDRNRLIELIDIYQSAKDKLLEKVISETEALGVTDFNPNSSLQIRKLLFDTLKLAPISTTDGRRWGDAAGNIALDDDSELAPSTDSTTLQILEDKHPVISTILNYRRIDQVCKTWLRYPEPGQNESTPGGGLLAKIWPDGRIHANFSQLAETGRFRHSKPNVANFPARAEGYLNKIFKDISVPNIRTIIVPSDNNVLIECDFKQAELYTLAALSGDDTMLSALTTPGKDLHDTTAMSSFGYSMIDTDGNKLDDNYFVDLAKKLESVGGANSREFKEALDSVRYVNAKGIILSRSEFKDNIRISGKNINFGISYGRGGAAIALQVKGETGTERSLDDLTSELNQAVMLWKTKTYPVAWSYLQSCARAVYNPGYLVNSWGRRRNFKFINDGKERHDLERQAQNWPIQSTVADTTMLAMARIIEYREKYNLAFKIVNQVHDSVMIEASKHDRDACIDMFNKTMGSIEIPMFDTIGTLTLGVDIEVTERWGE